MPGPIALTLNGLRVISARVITPWRGVWVADCELDVDDTLLAAPLLSAEIPAILTIGTTPYKGTIDPRGSGTFSNKASARVIGGGAGWEKTVPAQHFYNPGGALLSTLVYAATAPLVLEPPPLDPIPELLGTHYGRVAGPASSVFGDRDWHVDPLTGIAQVAPWLPLPLDPTATIADFDVTQLKAQVIADGPITPGALLIDPRFNGSVYTVRDVEQTFGPDGSHAECWCSKKPNSRLSGALANMVRQFADVAHLKTYRYRFVLDASVDGSKFVLQGITKGAPDLNPVEQWTGLSGGLPHLFPGLEVIVGFTGDNPPLPYVAAVANTKKPTVLDLDALTLVTVGGPAAIPFPVAHAPGVLASLIALQAEIAAIVAILNIPGPKTPADGTAATSALATGAAALATQALLIPSKKLAAV